MDNVPTTPPSWGSADEIPTTPVEQPTSPPPTTAQSSDRDSAIEAALLAFSRALETRVAAYIQTTYGGPVLEDYLQAREQNVNQGDVTAMLMFEARQGINIEQLFRDQEAQLLAEMEAQQPGSTAALFGLKKTEGSDV